MNRFGAFQILKFSFSGGNTTLVHSGILLVLVTCFIATIISNTIAFLVPLGISFFLQSKWTFGIQELTPVLFGVLSNTVIDFIAMDLLLRNKYGTVFFMIVITIPLTFAINKLWVFSCGFKFIGFLYQDNSFEVSLVIPLLLTAAVVVCHREQPGLIKALRATEILCTAERFCREPHSFTSSVLTIPEKTKQLWRDKGFYFFYTDIADNRFDNLSEVFPKHKNCFTEYFHESSRCNPTGI